jgi:hypothetical protein
MPLVLNRHRGQVSRLDSLVDCCFLRKPAGAFFLGEEAEQHHNQGVKKENAGLLDLEKLMFMDAP